jgi:hypothetical protein
MSQRFKSEDFREEVRKILQNYQKEYQSIAQPVVEKIIHDIQAGKPLVKAVSDVLSETSFFNANKEATVNAIYLAACAGYGVLPKIVVNSENIKKTLLADSWTPDKMALSTRIHGSNSVMRESIITTIRKSMLSAQTVKSMAMDLYDGYNSGKTIIQQAALPQYLQKIERYARWAADGDKEMVQAVLMASKDIQKQINAEVSPNLRAAYSKLISACKKFEIEAIDKAVHTALEEKSRYHAERIARTESARAWYDGFIAKNQNDADVWGYRWRLSSRHGLVPFDQCDVCANMNVGFGKGAYPKDKAPSIPRHPHCMCMLQVIYVWEINETQELQPEQARKYLDSLPEAKLQELFGQKGLQKYQVGGNWEKLLRGWDGFNEPESRVTKDDFQLQVANKNGKIEIGSESSLEQAKKRDQKIMITDIAINKVPRVKVPDFTHEQNELLHQVHKEALSVAMRENNSDEVSFVYNLHTNEKVKILGDSQSVDIDKNIQVWALRSNSYANELVVVHNHPSTSNFSLADIDYFLSDDYIGMMSVVTNQGEIYILKKSRNYDYEKAYSIEKDLIKRYTLDKQYLIANEFIKTCLEGGVTYVKGK